MSEEENDGTWSGLKKTIIGTLATVVTGGGVWLSTTLFGGGEEAHRGTFTTTRCEVDQRAGYRRSGTNSDCSGTHHGMV